MHFTQLSREFRAIQKAQSFNSAEGVVYKRMRSCLGPSMDPKLWGQLPPEVLLKIYKALPLRGFFQLRGVCKDWNRVACERRCFSDPIPKPYFVLIRQNREDAPTGTLTYNISSGSWIWKLHSLLDMVYISPHAFYDHFCVEGIFFHGIRFRGGLTPRSRQSLFDIPADEGIGEIGVVPRTEGGILGMMVDTSKSPYSFKLIRGSCDQGTLIIDSQTCETAKISRMVRWETKPSRMVRCRELRRSSSPKICMQCDGRMYVWSDLDEIQVYSLEDDKWTTLNPPPRHALDEDAPIGTEEDVQDASSPPQGSDFRGLGHWQGEIYAVTKNEQATLSVWKLVNRPLQEWREFERIPSVLFTYLLEPGGRLPIVTTHCNEYFLMHVLTLSDSDIIPAMRQPGRRYVHFNLSTKRWEIVELPNEQLHKRKRRESEMAQEDTDEEDDMWV